MKGCLLTCLASVLLLAMLSAWRDLPKDWGFSRLGWRIAPDTSRESMASDYLSTRVRLGMSRAKLTEDLGEPEHFNDCWTYVDDDAPAERDASPPRVPAEPALFVHFDREGRVKRLQYAQLPENESAPEFDAASWRVPANREAMAEALVRSGQLRRAGKADVLRLLGPPDSGGANLEYIVAPGGSDDVWLEFWFDHEDRLAEFRLDR